ncbi:GNAT family N-acetyltransferase [Paracoccaceae bacterium GXU_MW_L88]
MAESERRKARSTSLLEIRNSKVSDIPEIIALCRKVYPGEDAYTAGQLRGQIAAFPEGQFVALYEGEVVGFAATFRIKERVALADHSWEEVTGGGYGSRHDGKGEWLYGMEVCVDPDRRRLRIGQRLYAARRRLCSDLELKGIVFGGRMPGYLRRKKQFANPDAYLDAVREQEIRDSTLNFQMKAGFEPERVLHNYNPHDKPSGGHAVLMKWENPYFSEDRGSQPLTRGDVDVVRVASIQFEAREFDSEEQFYDRVDYFARMAADYGSDFVVFPEFFTLSLLTLDEPLGPVEAIRRLTEHTPTFTDRLRGIAVSRNINIIGGSHPTETDDGDIQNVSFVFLRDGTVHAQEKLHPTPDERSVWNIKGGDEINVIDTDCGPIGVAICYDSEFPEIHRRLVDQGARIVFTPFCTDTRHGYLRVKYCCQARAVENQCYIVTSGGIGLLDDVENLDMQYSQCGIYTPCDFPFAWNGIAAEASENVEMAVIADLDLGKLDWARREGSVRNLRDRRFDLYKVAWKDGG